MVYIVYIYFFAFDGWIFFKYSLQFLIFIENELKNWGVYYTRVIYKSKSLVQNSCFKLFFTDF